MRSSPALAIAAILAVTLAPAWLLSQFLAERMLQQEARRTQEFVTNIVLVEKAGDFLRGAQPAGLEAADAFAHLTQLPTVLHANMYSHQRKIVWSMQPALIGQQSGRNAELEQALRGEIVAYGGKRAKSEHLYLRARHAQFVEIYAPIRSDVNGEVLGVVELYTMPGTLFDDIRTIQLAVWACAFLSAILLLATLLYLQATPASLRLAAFRPWRSPPCR
jgi:hypothetical protein